MNFVVLRVNSYYSLYDFVYNEVNNLENAIYDSDFPRNKLLNFLKKIHISRKINKYINLPFKKIWIKLYFHNLKKRIMKKWNSLNNLCFIVDYNFCEWDGNSFVELLRSTFSSSKIVCFFQNIVSGNPNMQYILNNRNMVDLIYSFDNADAEKYGLKYHNIPFSDLSDLYPKQELKYDICFIGAAKNRLNEIIEAYKSFKNKGLKCCFYITGVPSQQQVLVDEINYCRPIPYKDLLKIVSESKCILEIIQKGNLGNSIRVNEAISLDKLLISNNSMLVNNCFYEPKYMKIYDNITDFDAKAFIDSIKEVHYENKSRMYPSAFFNQIEKDLKELNE